jgi:hypothetical protein
VKAQRVSLDAANETVRRSLISVAFKGKPGLSVALLWSTARQALGLNRHPENIVSSYQVLSVGCWQSIFEAPEPSRFDPISWESMSLRRAEGRLPKEAFVTQ